MKIVHVSSSFPPALGGMEKVVQMLAGVQSRSGLEVSVITSDQFSDGHIKNQEFPVTRLKSYKIVNTTIMPSLFPKLLRIENGSVVHLHITQAYTPEIVWLASKFRKYSYIAHVHLDIPPSSIAGVLLAPYKQIVLRRVLHSAMCVVVFTEDQKTNIVKKYGIPNSMVKVVPNGVEEKFYYNKLRSPHKKVRLLFVGRLSFQKNLTQFLRSLEGVSKHFETTLVGDGEKEAELKKLANDLNLKNITFAGRSEGLDLLNYYKSADIFVLTSEREGMPLVLLEAMAMGLPIIATDVTGIRDVVRNNRNGYLVKYGDIVGLRNTLLKTITDTDQYKRFSQASYKLSQEYSWEKTAEKFKKLYCGIM